MICRRRPRPLHSQVQIFTRATQQPCSPEQQKLKVNPHKHAALCKQQQHTQSRSWGSSSLCSNDASRTHVPYRAERCAAAPPLPISFNQLHLCGGPLPATLYKTVLRCTGAWRRSCGGFSISAEHMEPLGTSGLGLCWRTCTNLITGVG